MSNDKTNKVTLLGANGEELGRTPLKVASRAQIAFNAFQYHMNKEDNQGLLFALSQFTPVSEDGNMQISFEDETVQSFMLSYASSQIINEALDENINQACSLLLSYTDPQKFPDDGTVEITEGLLEEVKNRHVNVPELQIAQEVLDVQTEIYTTLRGLSPKQITSFQANRTQERFEDLAQYLTNEQIAAGYYNISIIHRALLAEKDIYDPHKNNAEKECLYKVIENTSDYKRIHYCVNRLGPDYKDRGMVRAAYRRSLAKANSSTELYKINTALAECYLAEYSPKIGFSKSEADTEPLLKAEMHYIDALKCAQDSEKPALLKKIGNLQLQQNRIEDWTETETKLAMDVLNGEERVHTLLKIANKNPRLRTQYLEFSLKTTLSSRQIKKDKKRILVSKIDYYLRPIYEKEGNEEGLSMLNQTLEKYKSGQFIGNPLEKYMKSKKTR